MFGHRHALQLMNAKPDCLPKSDCSWTITVRLLHTSGGRGGFPRSLNYVNPIQTYVICARSQSQHTLAISQSYHLAFMLYKVTWWQRHSKNSVHLVTLVASCFLGALPPVDLRAVCLVRAIVKLQPIQRGSVCELAKRFKLYKWFQPRFLRHLLSRNTNKISKPRHQKLDWRQARK